MRAFAACLAVAAAVLAGCAATPPAVPRSGIDLQYADPAVRPQDDLYRHVNGKWLDTFQLPADRAAMGSFVKLRDDTLAQLHALVEELARSGQPPGSEAAKLGDLYAACMDEARADALGATPLAPEFAAIDAVDSVAGLAPLLAHLQQIGVDVPFEAGVQQDHRDSTRYVVALYQGGLGLPDRDYYLALDDARLQDVRTRYPVHVARMLDLAGQPAAAAAAADIVALETALARIHWSKVENRDPVRTYNRVALAQLPELAPGFDWPGWLAAYGIAGRVDALIVAQPSYLAGLGSLLGSTPLPTWKAYLKWRLLSDAAPWLDHALVDENFAFYGTVISGTPRNRPRWERATMAVSQALGDALGRLYVEKYFPPRNKERIDALVQNLRNAYAGSIDALDWMGPQTRREAQQKLAKLVPKIGYPQVWRDYGALAIDRADAVGSLQRAALFETRHDLAKLGQPIDRTEWFVPPQTVNAYYSQEKNEVVFPAAILQPPFFDVQADDAVNYGAIGAVIGHEISHAFDDKGSQFDGDGNLREWFSPDDHRRFKALTERLVAQYARFSPLPGYRVNGELTLGENIADNAGLEIAYKAYQLSLHGRPAPVIDGMTGAQRFYAGFAQVWRAKLRDALVIRLLKIDPHAPSQFRCNGALVNQPGFYDAYGVKEGDALYLPPAERVVIW